MRKNRIRAASMRRACCVCFNAYRVSRDFSLRSIKALTVAFVSALRRMASLSFADMSRTVCYDSDMWELFQALFELLWYMFLYVFAMVIVPSWIVWKVTGWIFPSDD